MVRELFQMARSKKACIVFFDEVDAIGGARGGGDGSENEVQRTMLQIVTELDGFDARGNIKVGLRVISGKTTAVCCNFVCNYFHVSAKSSVGFDRNSVFMPFCSFAVQVLMATNRPDTLDPALLRPGRLDRKVCCTS